MCILSAYLIRGCAYHVHTSLEGVHTSSEGVHTSSEGVHTMCIPHQRVCIPHQRVCMPHQRVCMPRPYVSPKAQGRLKGVQASICTPSLIKGCDKTSPICHGTCASALRSSHAIALLAKASAPTIPCTPGAHCRLLGRTISDMARDSLGARGHTRAQQLSRFRLTSHVESPPSGRCPDGLTPHT